MTEHDLQELAISRLKADGYTYWIAPRVWGERDIFGVFDFIAAKRGKIYLVQLTTYHHIYDRRKKITAWLEFNNLTIAHAVIWGYDPKLKLFITERVLRAGNSRPASELGGGVTSPEGSPSL